jgi:hypothetical protein
MSKSEHPSMLPNTLPPGIEWRWVICVGGPLDGMAKEVPALLGFGHRVRWSAGVYMLGVLIEGTEIRVAYWWEE